MSHQTSDQHHIVGLWGAPQSESTKPRLWTSGAGAAEDLFDLSSLSKPIVTSSLLMVTCERSQWSWENFLEIRVSDVISELESTPLRNLKLRHLWEHRSGLPAHIDFLTGAEAGKEPVRTSLPAGWTRPKAWSKILAGILSQSTLDKLDPNGSRYSDLGFLMLGLWLERFYGRSIGELWDAWKLNHGVDPSALQFFGQRKLSPQPVRTEIRHPAGEVNDNNAFFLGGVAPHAGLLGSAADVWSWLRAVQAWANSTSKISNWIQVPANWSWNFYCGWDRPGDPKVTMAGAGAPADTIGHLGYSGTALWWSPKQDCAGVLLTNRIYPAPNAENAEMIKFLRREFFTALWQGTLNEAWQIPINKSGYT